jgi:hypothetical protein
MMEYGWLVALRAAGRLAQARAHPWRRSARPEARGGALATRPGGHGGLACGAAPAQRLAGEGTQDTGGLERWGDGGDGNELGWAGEAPKRRGKQVAGSSVGRPWLQPAMEARPAGAAASSTGLRRWRRPAKAQLRQQLARAGPLAARAALEQGVGPASAREPALTFSREREPWGRSRRSAARRSREQHAVPRTGEARPSREQAVGPVCALG